MQLLQVGDLFALGVGFDIGGGYLVARGLAYAALAAGVDGVGGGFSR
jgi:hypothetical protein